VDIGMKLTISTVLVALIIAWIAFSIVVWAVHSPNYVQEGKWQSMDSDATRDARIGRDYTEDYNP
jgi:ABC-type uncharacterized transport system permease subunit